MQTFADPLHRAERCFADDEAMVCGDVRLRFGEVVDRCRRLAGLLDSMSAGGDRIAVLAANSHQYVELYCAAPASGRIVMPINSRHAAAEIEYVLRDAGPRVLFTDRSRDELGPLADRVEHVIELGDEYEERIDAAPRAVLGRGVAEDDVAGLFYTGGTTGASKGVMITHRNKIADTLHLQASVRLEPGETWQVMSPLFHASGSFNVLLCLWLGARQVVLPGFEAKLALDTIEREGSTVTFGVPTVMAATADEQSALPRDVSSLRLFGFGAAPASSTLLRRFHGLFPDTELVSMYGATELGPMGTTFEHLERELDTGRTRTVGRPVLGVELRILAADGSELRRGEVGEVVLRGPAVMRGYWNKPEQTAEVMRDGWYHSGDMGYLDEAGCLFLVDRQKDMIISGGENVYSTEVEEVLYQHPDVAECAVYGVPDDKWGEAVRASVVLREGGTATVEDLESHCRASLAGYKIPKTVEIHAEPLPKTGAGKILKRDLRAPFWGDTDRNIH